MENNLKQLRKERKLTIRECSEYLHVPARTYQNWELGTRSCPDYVLLYVTKELEKYGKKAIVEIEDGKIIISKNNAASPQKDIEIIDKDASASILMDKLRKMQKEDYEIEIK